MSDDLDPQLMRQFAQAAETLPEAPFHTRVTEQLHRGRIRRVLTNAMWAALRGLLAGFGVGLATPFQKRVGRPALFALAAAALMAWAAF